MWLAGPRKLRVGERIDVFLTRMSCIPVLFGGHIVTTPCKVYQGPGSRCVVEVTSKNKALFSEFLTV